MATDDERREVARRLREYSGGRKAFHLGRLCAACGIDKSRLMSRTTDADAEAWAHLADLIEPSGHECVPGECPPNVRHDNDRTDQERLPAIATTMAADSVRSAKQGSSVSPVYILHAARNIAEACGETFGSIRNRELAEWGTSIVPKETIVDRDALLELADEMEEFGNLPVKHPGVRVLHSDDFSRELGYARRIREAVDACEARPDTPAAGDKEQTATDAHADGNEAADGARTPSIEVLRWVNGRGGLDAVRKSVEQSECRKKLLDCFAMRLGFESLEDLGDILKELEKRIMPEGYEWPRYESGELLRYRDRYISDGSECEVWHIDFDSYGEATILNSDCSKCSLEKGERVKRPTVLAGDGEPLEVGQTVWRDDGEMLEVLYLRPDGLVDCCGEIERPERLTHERPDSWERLEEDGSSPSARRPHRQAGTGQTTASRSSAEERANQGGSMQELKSCPCCGSSNGLYVLQEDEYGEWSVFCDMCKTSFQNENHCDTREDAISAWNRRAERTCRNLNPPSCRDFECSECGESSEFTPGFMPNYCPHCGARVIEEGV